MQCESAKVIRDGVVLSNLPARELVLEPTNRPTVGPNRYLNKDNAGNRESREEQKFNQNKRGKEKEEESSMAPKQPEDNPNMTSLSDEEEEEESGSSRAESKSTRENSKKDNCSDEEADDQSKSTQTSAVKKLEADSEDESDSDYDSEPTQKTTKSIPPESSKGNRLLKQTDDFEVKKKKIKTSHDEEEEEEVKKISRDEAKQVFQRLFSESDEIALLQGILDFTSTRGDPQRETDVFLDYVKNLINFNANRSQIVTKIQRLKKKFANTVKNSLRKGKSEEEIVFSKDLDQKAFELS